MGLRGLVRVLSRLTFVTRCGVRVVRRLFMLTGIMLFGCFSVMLGSVGAVF